MSFIYASARKDYKVMDFVTLILLALGLAADAFAVSITNGMCSSRVTKRNALLMAFTFGFFQALMPVLGFILGNTFAGFVFRFQHWIALLLLGAIGVNMLSDALRERDTPEEEGCSTLSIFQSRNLILQGIATSIDALAAGVSIAVLNINILTSALIIGMITFLLCAVGVYIGKRFGNILGFRAKVLGGIVLIGIGARIFIENHFF
jgi:putative Mn2+ efflux pump MntP